MENSIFAQTKYVMAKLELDSLDRKILRLLSQDARMPFLEVARLCNVSGASVHQRVQKLEECGVLAGSRFIVSPKALGYNMCAYIGLYLHDPSCYESVITALRDVPQVVECHYTTGSFDMFIKIYARDNNHLLNTIHDKLMPLGIERTETIVSFNVVIDRPVPVLEDDEQ